MKDKIKGLWTALWTPTDQNGKLLKEPLKHHIDFLFNKGIDGIVLGGSTGQFPLLELATRKELISFVVKHVGPERVIVNISDIRPATVEELALDSDQKKVRAVMLLPPLYYQYAQNDIAHFFVHMAKIAKRPLILYNFPECARNVIEIDTLEAVFKAVPMAGIKHSGSDFDFNKQLVASGKKNGFTVFTGTETRFSEALALGVEGYIGGLSNAVPELILEIYNTHQKGLTLDEKGANGKIKKIDNLISKLFFPLNISALMEARGFNPGAIKEAIAPATRKLYAELVSDLREVLHNFCLGTCPEYQNKS